MPGAVTAQEITLDTVIGLAGTDTLDVGVPIEFRLRVANSSGDTYDGATNGFRLYSPDGATWVPHIYYDTTIIQIPSADTIVDTTYYGRWADNIYIDSVWDGGYFVNTYSDHDDSALTPDLFGQGSDTIGFGGYQQAKWGLYDNFDEIMYTVRLDSIPASSGRLTICLDSAFYRPTGYWKWSDPDTIASWDGPHCFKIKRGGLIFGGDFGEGGEDLGLETPTYDINEDVLFSGPIDRAISHFELFKGRFDIPDPMNELKAVRGRIDSNGNTHVRFQQYKGGIRVLGGEVVVHEDSRGEIMHINGDYLNTSGLGLSPSVSKSQAISYAVGDFESGEFSADELSSELLFFPMNGNLYLSWELTLDFDSAGSAIYYVDAQTGDVLAVLPTVWRDRMVVGEGTGTLGDFKPNLQVYQIELYNPPNYYLLDYSRNDSLLNDGYGDGMVNGSIIRALCHPTDDDGFGVASYDSIFHNSWNPTYMPTSLLHMAVDAHVYTGWFYDWLRSEFGWNSYDDGGSSMTITVANIGGFGGSYSHEDKDVHIGLPESGKKGGAACLDLIGHEWTHGVTHHSSDLVYAKESGALNEAFSNMMGTAFEFAYADSTDSISANWRFMEYYFAGADSAITSLENPLGDSLRVAWPDYYGGTNWIPVDTCTPIRDNDWCYVHQNSGVGGKWFHLLSVGGEHYGIQTQGIGLDEATRLALDANTNFWTSNIDYHEAALQSCYAALIADTPRDTATAREANLAWYAVGVMEYSDSDQDNYWIEWDNCPDTANPDQADTDNDGIGDVCESSCCQIRGDLNRDLSLDIADLTFLVSYMFKSGDSPDCFCDANIDGSGQDLCATADITIADLTHFVGYMFKGGPAPVACP